MKKMQPVKTLMKCTFIKWTLALVTFSIWFVSSASAGVVNFESTGTSSKSGTVMGTWGYDDKVSFGSAGKYTMNLAETSPSFDVLRATLYNNQGNIIDLLIDNNSARSTKGSFNVGKGDYYLSLFAITDSNYDTGQFEVYIDLFGNASPVPLPPAAILMASALMCAASFVRKKTSFVNKSA